MGNNAIFIYRVGYNNLNILYKTIQLPEANLNMLFAIE